MDVGVGVEVALGSGLLVGVGVGVDVGVGVEVAFGAGLLVGVGIGVGREVAVGAGVAVFVGVGVSVGVWAEMASTVCWTRTATVASASISGVAVSLGGAAAMAAWTVASISG